MPTSVLRSPRMWYSLSNELPSIYEIRQDWKNIVRKLNDAAKEVLGEAEVVPFGSVVAGNAAVASDIDVLIIAEDLPKSAWRKAQIISKIEEETGLPPFHPVQIHLITWQEAETNPIYAEVLKTRKK